MKTLKNNSVRLCAVAAMSLMATQLQAQIARYNTQSAFLGAVGVVTVEDFTSTVHYPLGPTLNSSSSYTPTTGLPISPGDIKAGVTYSSAGGPLLIDGQGGFTGGFLDGIQSYGTVAGPLTASFAGQVFGFGFHYNSLGGPYTIQVNTLTSSSTFSFSAPDMNLQFIGFTSVASDIVSAAITGKATGIYYAIDDFTFSKVGPSAVVTPEPASFAMMAFGMISLGGFAARRRKSTK